MNAIKNVGRIKEHLTSDALDKLEAGAALHKRHSNITFKIINLDATSLDIRAEQGKSASGNYADQSTLITRTRELFCKFFPDLIIYVHAVPYKAAAIDAVTPQWINQHMHAFGININTFVSETGIDRSNFSAWINELRPMSGIVKALIFQTVKLYALRALVKYLDAVEGEFKQYFMNVYFDKELITLIVNGNHNMKNYHVEIIEPDETGRLIINMSKRLLPSSETLNR